MKDVTIKGLESNSSAFKKTPTLCYLPFIHMEADAKGWLKPCCMAEDPVCKGNPITDFHPGDKATLAEPYDLNKGDTVSDAFNSPDMKQMRQDFLDDKKPIACKKCWDEEDAGLESKRIGWARYFSNHFPQLQNIFEKNITEQDIIYLDLKLGTICNLKCRICGSWSSSKWAQEEIEIDIKFHGRKKEDTKKLPAYYNLKQGEWPRKNPKFWKDLEMILPNVKHLEFTGGEPWMIKEHFEVLRTLIDKEHAKNISLHYNTNGTQLPKKEFNEILPHFKHCKISFSVDDTGDRFEYQRYGAKWNEVNENIEYICNNKKHMTTEICTTINLFNLHNLIDVAEWVSNIKNLDSWYINLMHYPAKFNIAIHDNNVKDIIAYDFESYDWNKLTSKARQNNNKVDFELIYTSQIKPIISYMYDHDPHLGHKEDDNQNLQRYMLTDIYKIDSIRNKTLNEVDEALAEHIGYNFNEIDGLRATETPEKQLNFLATSRKIV